MEEQQISNSSPKKNRKMLGVVLLVLAIACVTAGYLLNQKGSTTLKNEPKKLESPYQMSGNSLEDFDLQFLKLENQEVNKLYSPLSIKYALQMLSTGTSGTSKDQLDSIIGKYKLRKYTNNSNMSFANAMFVKDSFKSKVKDSYVSNLKTKYDADVVYDSFSSAKALNDWVSQKTFKFINNIANDQLVKKNNFVLANALAINMDWKTRIQPDVAMGDSDNNYFEYKHEKYSGGVEAINGVPTSSILFNNKKKASSLDVLAVVNNYDIVKELGRDNIKKTVKREFEAYLNSNNEKATADEIDKYAENFIKELDSNYHATPITTTDFSIYVDNSVKAFAKDLKTYDGTTLEYVGIMPVQDNLTNFIKNSTAESINKITSSLKAIKNENFSEGKVVEIKGSIPVFKFDYELSLKDDLKSLGVKDVFDENKANLTEFTTEKSAYVEDTIHKAAIEFSNQGIKAGAASVVVGGAGSASDDFDYQFDVPIEKIDITFDKPYMFIIRDKATGEVWFTGTVYEPTEAKLTK